MSIQKPHAKKTWTLSAVLGILIFTSSLFAGPTAAEAVVLDSTLREQVVMLPVISAGEAVDLETTIFKPPGIGPFPLVIMNHGKALGSPRNQHRDRFVSLSREFVKRGYAVIVPMRKGFSKSTGDYVDPGCDMTAHGQTQADDLQGVVEYLRTQSWVDRDHIIIAGQSYGGLTALAFGTRQFPGVRGLINFAGGLKMHGGDCHWQQSLVQAFADYGAKTTLPSIWFYGENDHHFGPELAARLYSAYNHAGGHATLVAYGPFKKDAHGMSASRDGIRIWWPETEKFLKEVGMPTDQVVALDDEVKVPEHEYAAIDDVKAIPYLKGSAREQYRAFLGKSLPRAFAVSASGAWSWAEDGDDPVEQALEDCQQHSSVPCKLYAVDNHVVWADGQQPVMATAAPVSTPEPAPAVAPVQTASAPAQASTAAVTGP
ncbi:MAG TPA: CocE/NonD family hydrolase [Noviherbaspirillum sp.]|uniref:dienelactone hydrolase family protein n=1 Tax=Noviherbaspirillum sp. TaxID=1926288 RepID=UPI002B47DCF0|nr:CocE/NonD family hydrolase [Noviherbaspirillum sp.]HJV87424.1 CocE/NonD family hydrolase [Noviherbaspirillum sp.]